MSGYTTEKIWEAFAGDTVPIYWGDPDIAEEFNPEAFVNCHQYSSFEEVLEDVKAIDNCPARYLKMMKSPAMTSTCAASHYLFSDCLDVFLCHIFDQDLHAAKRVSGGCANENYVEARRVQANLYARYLQQAR